MSRKCDGTKDFKIPCNCFIQGPAGPQGPQGPQGPAGESGLSAYGGRYNDEFQFINLTIGSTEQVPLPSTMPNSNTTYSDNSITVLEDGVYEINYFMYASVKLATLITLAVRNNGTDIPSTVISRLVEVDTGTIYSGSTIVTLSSGDEIDMAISALVAVGITLGTGVNATLTLKKIN